jgi:4-carboxymuconolactone decarboxylase
MSHFAGGLLAAAWLLATGVTTRLHAQTQPPAQPEQPSRAQQLMGDIAPKLAELTDNMLFGDIWERPGLSKRGRSLVTVCALNRPDQLRSHLVLARHNVVPEVELNEAITLLAFYSGWPNAVSAVAVAREVFKQRCWRRSRRQQAASAAAFARRRKYHVHPGFGTVRPAALDRNRFGPEQPRHCRPARRLAGPQHWCRPELHGRGTSTAAFTVVRRRASAAQR